MDITLIRELEQCKNIYDIMSWAYKQLIPYSPGKCNESCEYKNIDEAFGKFIEINNTIGNSDIKDLIKTITKYINDNNESLKLCSPSFFYNIIQQVDRIPYKFPTIKLFKRFENKQKLNSLHYNNIYIFPKIKNTIIDAMEAHSRKYEICNQCKTSFNCNNCDLDFLSYNDSTKHFGLRTRKSNSDTSSINDSLENYLICYSENFTPNMYIFKDEQFIKNIKDRESLNIAIMPLTNESIENLFDLEYNYKSFEINNAKKDKVLFIQEIFETQLRKVATCDVDIIIFPEMYLTDELVNNMTEVITNAFSSMSFYDSTKLIVTGTQWKNQSNICYIYDSSGQLIYQQHKFTPFRLKGKLEHLESNNNYVNFLDIYELGRIFTLICKDIESLAIKGIFKDTLADICLYSAYSPSLNVIKHSEDLAKTYNMITVFANACAAIPTDKKYNIGYSAIPQRKNTYSSCYIEKYGCKCTKCESLECEPQILKIEFSNFMLNNNELNCKMTYQ